MKKVVEIHKSHQNERKSKRNFETLLDNLNMRLAFPWADNDYGIDGHIELISPIKNSESFRPDSKFFLIQLKSTERLKKVGKSVSFSVPVKKIFQWFSANIPVMLVINDLESNSFYFIWIDENLISTLENSNSNWVNQGDIALRITENNYFSNHTSEAIKDYVLSWKIPTRKIIQAGTYFDLNDKCKANLEYYKEITKEFKFESVNNALINLSNQIEQAIYRIAITGPSRVGKSTLINALVKRKDVSPTGFFQTTGVPIQILPGKEDLIKITFKSGKVTSEKFSYALIENYASQTKNEDNNKDVALVAIHLANRQLEQGVSFYDIPGLDDPDDNIYTYTWKTVTKANTILYLIDASPFENGGYIFKNEYKKQILELGQSLDKIFLVFSKINALTGNKLQLLQERVTQDLKKLNLYDKVSGKVYFISAEESLEVRTTNKKGADTVKKLEDDIWTYLLKESKVGLVNLSFINKEIINSTKDFEGIIRARLLDDEKRKKLNDAIASVNSKIPELGKFYYAREKEIKTAIKQSLENRKNNLLFQLETYLKSFSPNVELPSKKEMQNYLAQGGHQTLEETNKEYNHQVNLQKAMIDSWIEENLKLVREIIDGNSEKKLVDFSDIEKFEPPAIDLSTSFGVGLLAGFVAFIINPPAAILAGLSAFFGSLWFSASERRAIRIMKIMEAARRSYNDQFKKITDTYLNCIDENSAKIIEYANKKINLFFTDLNIQTAKLNTPISAEEEKQYKKAFVEIDKLRTSINKLNEEINSLYSPI